MCILIYSDRLFYSIQHIEIEEITSLFPYDLPQLYEMDILIKDY